MNAAFDYPVISSPFPIHGHEDEQIAFLMQFLSGFHGKMKLVEMQGGTTNRVFHVTLNGWNFVARIFGEGTDIIISRERERHALVVTGAARIYGVFGNGMLMSYIEGRPLESGPVRDAHHRRAIARALARMHRATVGTVEGNELFTDTRLSIDPLPVEKRDRLLARLKAFEVSLTSHFGVSPLCLCHCDLSSQNTIIGSDGEARFIDYEYALVTWPAFDIAYHFCECTGLRQRLADFPTAEMQSDFCGEYLAERLRPRVPDSDDVLRLVSDVALLVPMASFRVAVWAEYQALVSKLPFPYEKYAAGRYAMVDLPLPLDPAHPRYGDTLLPREEI